MTDNVFEDLGNGLRRFRHELNAWAFSPDDQWLAVCSAGALRVLECETGREVMTVQGRGASGVGWLSHELVLVLRPQDFGVRAVVHAVPDGGVISSVALVGMNRSTSAISCAAVDGDGAVRAALVTPARWHGGVRGDRARGRGYVLVPPSWEVAAELDPDAMTVVTRLPFARPAVAEMSPDGEAVALWLGEPGPQGVSAADRGSVVLYEWRTKRAVKVASAANEAVEMRWCDPTRIALRGAFGGATSRQGGEVVVVDTRRAERIYDSVEDGLLDRNGGPGAATVRDVAAPPTNPRDLLRGWPGATATMDLHPDGERLLVAGRWAEDNRVRFTGALAVIDVASGSRAALRDFAAKPEVAMGAQWTGDGERVLVLGSRVASRTRVEQWASPRSGPERGAEAWEFAVPTKPRRPATLTRSPTGRWMAVDWVESTTRRQRGDDGPMERGALMVLDAQRARER